MRLKKLEIAGFKSFAHPVKFIFDEAITGIVGPNGSGKSNVVEAFRFALGEQSIKSLRGGSSTDLLFKSGTGGRALSHASVSLTFDNSDRVFRLEPDIGRELSVDFDTITVTREITSDGTQRYLINDSPVRLRDIAELIASVNIGASGHHIISQGEADRMLFMNVKERREVLEAAFGLKIYQYRIAESTRKIEKSHVHMRESQLLLRELEPQLKFLRREIQKVERAHHVQIELATIYRDLLQTYHDNIQALQNHITTEQSVINERIERLQSSIITLEEQYTQSQSVIDSSMIATLTSKLRLLESQESENIRHIGKIEGLVESLESQIKSLSRAEPISQPITNRSSVVERTLFDSFIFKIRTHIEQIRVANNMASVLSEIDKLSVYIEQSLSRIDGVTQKIIPIQNNSEFIDTLRAQLASAHAEFLEFNTVRIELEQQKKQIQDQISDHQSQISTLITSTHSLERELSNARNTLQAAQYTAQSLRDQCDELGTIQSDYERELVEFKVLLGEEFNPGPIRPVSTTNVRQLANQITEKRRSVERLKIKLEELGVSNPQEIITEHENSTQRYEFLQREVSDLELTINSLEQMIVDLREKLNEHFAAGIAKVNKSFGEFFIAMFGGGSAEINVITLEKKRKKMADINTTNELSEDEHIESEREVGVDITVQIPRKRTGDLAMLSGGERSLTAIALLFALSQVNPPPFVVLDETDAALDESNSRKYGQLLQKLSEHSQLVVITHNRETMNHCHTLYGVTLGRDSASQLFSIKLNDAMQYAK